MREQRITFWCLVLLVAVAVAVLQGCASPMPAPRNAHESLLVALGTHEAASATLETLITRGQVTKEEAAKDQARLKIALHKLEQATDLLDLGLSDEGRIEAANGILAVVSKRLDAELEKARAREVKP